MLKGGLFLLTTLILPAQLQFEKTELSLDIPAEAETYDIAFPFRVLSNTSLAEIDEKCSCMKGAFSGDHSAWSTGDTGVFTLTLDTSLIHGSTSKKVEIHFSDQESLSLSVNIHVPIAITSDIKTHKWQVAQEAETKEYLITISPEFNFQIETISRSNTAFDFSLSPAEGLEQTYKLSVTPNDLSKAAFCLFKLETDSKIPRYKSFSLMAIVR